MNLIQKINMNGVNYIDRLGCKLKVEIKAIDDKYG